MYETTKDIMEKTDVKTMEGDTMEIGNARLEWFCNACV